jgi:hypothetical protein
MPLDREALAPAEDERHRVGLRDVRFRPSGPFNAIIPAQLPCVRVAAPVPALRRSPETASAAGQAHALSPLSNVVFE